MRLHEGGKCLAAVELELGLHHGLVCPLAND